MTRFPPILLLCAALVACGRQARVTEPPPPTPVAIPWTPERISADPEGYLRHALDRIGEQIRIREAKREELRVRRGEVEQRSGGLVLRMDEIGNLRRRLAAAVDRAEDEDRWPLRFAGRELSREQAASVQAAAEQFLSSRRDLAAAYRDAVARLEQLERSVLRDIDGLGRLREKVALDLERVRLNQGIAELARLRQTEENLARFTTDVSALTDDPLAGIILGAEDDAAPADLFPSSLPRPESLP